MATLAKHGTDLNDTVNRDPIAYTKASASYVTTKAYLLAITIRMTEAGVPSLTLGGTNLSFAALGSPTSYVFSGSIREITWFYEVTPSADTTTTITIDAVEGAANCRAVMIEVTDPHATTPFLNVVSAADATDTSDAPTVTLAALQGAGSVAYFWVHWNHASITLDVSGDGLTPVSGIGGSELPSTGGGYKINETTPAGVLSAAIKWAAIGVEVQEAAAAAPQTFWPSELVPA